MDNIYACFMLIFGCAFFLHCIKQADVIDRRDTLHTDSRNDLAYERMMQERREFGYDRVEKAITSRPFYRKYRFK